MHPRAQFFGTKGFFADYDARLDEPLTESVAELWKDGFEQQRKGRLDPAKLAAAIHDAGKKSSPPSGRTRGEVLLEMWKATAQ